VSSAGPTPRGRGHLWAARLAREANDGGALAATLIETGKMAAGEDRHALSGRLLALAVRVARRHGKRDFEGEAWLELGLMRHELGHTAEAPAHFRAAIEAFGPGNPRLLRMGWRVGERWLAEGQYQAAVHVFLALASRTTGPLGTAVVAGLARACAAIGWEWNFEAAWNAAWQWLGHVDHHGQVAALLQLARGAVIRRQWVRARGVVFAALQMALKGEDAEQLDEAARMLAVVGLPKKQRTRELVEEAFPDLAIIRLGRAGGWDEDKEPEPWRPEAAVRALVDAFVQAVRQCPQAGGRTAAL
jgi:hypothetical protein